MNGNDPATGRATFDRMAAPLLQELETVQFFQHYCRESERASRAAPWRVAHPLPRADTPFETPALDARERALRQQLATLRRACGILLH